MSAIGNSFISLNTYDEARYKKIDIGNSTIVYDRSCYQPLYTYEFLTKQNSIRCDEVKKINKINKYKMQKLDNHTYAWTASLKDYNNSGFSRGHMINVSNHANNIKDFKETSTMENIAPQFKEFNDSQGLWGKVESIVKDLLYKLTEEDQLEVISGPVFQGELASIKGENKTIPVATHFFKAVFLNNSLHSAYFLPHIKDQRCDVNKYKLASISELNSVVNLNFSCYKNSSKLENEKMFLDCLSLLVEKKYIKLESGITQEQIEVLVSGFFSSPPK